MKNYKIIVQYDGTRYKGWQVQKSTDATIQGKLQMVLSKLAGHPVEVIGSGRTDAGVHANGQVANFHIEEHFFKRTAHGNILEFSTRRYCCDTDRRSGRAFSQPFHAVSKTYSYRIRTSPIPSVFDRRYLYQYGGPLDVGLMEQAAQLLIGTHDFVAFCGNKHMKKSTVRTIMDISFVQKEDEITILYTGDGFLQNMIRILTGTLIEVGRKERSPESMKALLEAKKRELAGYTAPPQGLRLEQVEYGTVDGHK